MVIDKSDNTSVEYDITDITIDDYDIECTSIWFYCDQWHSNNKIHVILLAEETEQLIKALKENKGKTMKIMRQVKGSALWTEITVNELFTEVRGLPTDLTELFTLLKAGYSTETVNYQAISDGKELGKEIESKCTEFIIMEMDRHHKEETEAKNTLILELSLLIEKRFKV